MRCEVLSRSGERVQFYISPGDNVGSLLQKVSSKFKYPESSIRLFYCGKELKPNSKSLELFDIGKFGSLIHMTTTTIDIIDNDVNNNEILPLRPLIESNNSSLIDLTNINDSIIQSTSNRGKRKFSIVSLSNNNSTNSNNKDNDNDNVEIIFPNSTPTTILSSSLSLSSSSSSSPITPTSSLSISSQSPPQTNSLNNPPLTSNKTLRLNISRALHHRLCIVETRVLNFTSDTASNAIEFVIQGSEGSKDRHRVFLGTSVSCSCEESNKDIPCRHILFILIKVHSFY